MEGVIASTIKAQHVSNEMQFRISTRVRLHSFLFEHELCFFPSYATAILKAGSSSCECLRRTSLWCLLWQPDWQWPKFPLLKHLTFVLSCLVLERRLIVPRIPILLTLDLSLVMACAGIATPIIFLATAASFAAFMSSRGTLHHPSCR